MRRMCGLSSQTRKRSLLKSMRNMARPLRAYRESAVYPALTISRRGLTNGFGRSSRHVSGPELLAQDALFQAVAGVEQHAHRDGLVGEHFDPDDVARLVMIGDRRHRTLVRVEHLDDDIGGVGEQGAAPAPWPERADRRQ